MWSITGLLMFVSLLTACLAKDCQYEFTGSEMRVEDNSREYVCDVQPLHAFNFTCVVKKVFPRPVTLTIKLRNGSEVIDQDIERIEEALGADNNYTVSVRSILNATDDMEGVALFCQAIFPDGKVSMSREVIVQIAWPVKHHGDSRIGPFGWEETCSSISRPPTTIVWKIDDEVVNDLPGDDIRIQTESFKEENGMTRVVSKLTVSDPTKYQTLGCEWIYRNQTSSSTTVDLKKGRKLTTPTNRTYVPGSKQDMPPSSATGIRFGWLIVLSFVGIFLPSSFLLPSLLFL